MNKSAFEPHCPQCKAKLVEVLAEEEVDTERGPFACPHCGASFAPEDAFSHTSDMIEKDLQERLDKIGRG